MLSMQPSAGVQLVRRGSSFSLKSGYSAKSNDSLATVVTVSKENLNRVREKLFKGHFIIVVIQQVSKAADYNS